MAWLAVTKQGGCYLYHCKPKRIFVDESYGSWDSGSCCIGVNKAILKVIGRELSWQDEPVELTEETLVKPVEPALPWIDRNDDLSNPPDYSSLRDDYWELWDYVFSRERMK